MLNHFVMLWKVCYWEEITSKNSFNWLYALSSHSFSSQYPLINYREENSSPIKKKKAKRSEKMITIKVPTSNHSEKKNNLPSISRSKSLPRNSKETRKSVDLKTWVTNSVKNQVMSLILWIFHVCHQNSCELNHI